MSRYPIISLFAALLILTGCTNSPPAGSVAGYVTTSSTDEYSNRCAVDPIGDIGSLVVDPPYVEAYNSGKSPWSKAWAPTGHDGDGDGLIHHEGIQRITRDGKNYFVVSDAVKTGYDPGIEIVQLGSRGGTHAKLGQNVTPSNWPPHEDNVADYLPLPFGLTHAGGIQVNGSYAIIPLEEPSYHHTAGFTITDLTHPSAPRWGALVWRTQGNTVHAGDASLTRLSDGRFMALIFGNNSEDVEVFVTSKADLSSSWISEAQTATPDTFHVEDHGPQNVQFVTGCDGKLFVVVTRGVDEDWVDLWQVGFSPTYVPTFTKVATRHLMCSTANTGETRYCDFNAGAGSYVSDTGAILLYGVEFYNDVLPDSDFVVGVREFYK